MKFAVIYRPKHPAPGDQVPELLKEMGAWMQNHGQRIEGLQFFVAGGGFGTIETDDPGEIQRLIADHPFTPYSDVEVKLLIGPEPAMTVLAEAYS
jgi:hypothetical protein